MSLDLPPESGEPELIEPRPRRNLLTRFNFFALLVLSLATMVLILNRPSSTLTWLTPAQLTRETQPGIFANLREKLRPVINPLKRLIHGRNYQNQQINFKLRTFEISLIAAGQLDLGSPASTNKDG